MAHKDSKEVDKKQGGKSTLRVRWHPLKLLAWMAAMTLALSLLVAGVGYVIYRNLTESVNLLIGFTLILRLNVLRVRRPVNGHFKM